MNRSIADTDKEIRRNLEKEDDERKKPGQKKRKKRHKKIRKQMTNFKLIYCNINHIKSKLSSLERIVEEEKPAVVALVETKLGENEDIEIEGY